MKKLMIPVAVILICALVLFGASSVLAGTSEAKAQEGDDAVVATSDDEGTEVAPGAVEE